jgi:excisionase family DNA binding protein
MSELLTTSEAAKRIKLSTRSVRMLVEAGKICVTRVGLKGGRMYFTPKALEDYLESCQSFGSRGRRRRASSRHQEPRSA